MAAPEDAKLVVETFPGLRLVCFGYLGPLRELPNFEVFLVISFSLARDI